MEIPSNTDVSKKQQKFPCNSLISRMEKYKAGENKKFSVQKNAVEKNRGGPCGFAITYGSGTSPEEIWGVVMSEPNCFVESSKSSHDMNILIPESYPAGEGTMAFFWMPNTGDTKFYHECINVKIDSQKKAPISLPEMPVFKSPIFDNFKIEEFKTLLTQDYKQYATNAPFVKVGPMEGEKEDVREIENKGPAVTGQIMKEEDVKTKACITKARDGTCVDATLKLEAEKPAVTTPVQTYASKNPEIETPIDDFRPKEGAKSVVKKADKEKKPCKEKPIEENPPEDPPGENDTPPENEKHDKNPPGENYTPPENESENEKPNKDPPGESYTPPEVEGEKPGEDAPPNKGPESRSPATEDTPEIKGPQAPPPVCTCPQGRQSNYKRRRR
ncbi:hypothetical protein HMI55_003458 [Coelomomyces lativittatus]|nr:hypothetical protein HMI55_003458 [Coelomomyces lativittatus]